MPLYSSDPTFSPGIRPALDQNAPTPAIAEVTDVPGFYMDLMTQLGAVRQELSNLWAKYNGPKSAFGKDPNPYDPYKGPAIQQQIEYQRERDRLEESEAGLIRQINDYAYVAGLSAGNDHDADDEPDPSEHQSGDAKGGDDPGTTAPATATAY